MPVNGLTGQGSGREEADDAGSSGNSQKFIIEDSSGR